MDHAPTPKAVCEVLLLVLGIVCGEDIVSPFAATATPKEFFAYDAAVPDAEAGMALPNVWMLAQVHGWETTVDTDYEAGLCIVVSGAAVRRG